MKNLNKYLLFLIIALLLSACNNTQVKLKTSPNWYKNQELKISKQYEILGYGEGISFEIAKAKAKESIAQTLQSKVSSSFESAVKDSNGVVDEKSRSNLRITTKLNLHDLKVIKKERVANKFFVALKYENLDLSHKIKDSLDSKCVDENVDYYMKQTLLFKTITAGVGCDLDLKLDRQNSAWYLKYKEKQFLLNDDELEELFVSVDNKNLNIKANKKVLVEGDSFYFTIDSKEDGYVTLVNVYENGIVSLLRDSQPITQTIQIPSKKDDNYFEAGVLNEDEDSYDLFVTIFSKEPLNMSRFEQADEEFVINEMAYKFDELIEILNDYEYSSLFIRTKVNND